MNIFFPFFFSLHRSPQKRRYMPTEAPIKSTEAPFQSYQASVNFSKKTFPVAKNPLTYAESLIYYSQKRKAPPTEATNTHTREDESGEERT